MSYSEIITGSYRPRIAMEFAWDQSSAGSGAGFRDVYILADRVAAGLSTANEVRSTPFADGDDAAAWFGAGSIGAFMARQLFRGGKLKHKVYGAAVASPSGGSNAAAVQTFIFATTANADGSWRINVAGAIVDVAVESGDTATVQGDSLVTAFNALSADLKPPCTLVNSSGTVTATMNNFGLFGNTAPSYQIVTGDEPGATTLTIAAAKFASGVGDPTLTTVLANLGAVETPIILIPYQTAATVALVNALADSKCDGEGMGHCRVVACDDDSVANLVTHVGTANGSTGQRLSFLGVTNSGSFAPAIAAWFANMLSSVTDYTRPFNNAPLEYCIAPPASGDYPTNTELDTLLEAGVTPVAVKGSSPVITKAINAAVLAGNVPVSIAITDGADLFRYYLNLDFSVEFTNKKLADDGDENIDDNTVTPSGILDRAYHVAKGDKMKGVLRDVDDLFPEWTCTIDPDVDGRVNLQVEFAVMNGLDQIFAKLRQRNGVIASAS